MDCLHAIDRYWTVAVIVWVVVSQLVRYLRAQSQPQARPAPVRRAPASPTVATEPVDTFEYADDEPLAPEDENEAVEESEALEQADDSAGTSPPEEVCRDPIQALLWAMERRRVRHTALATVPQLENVDAAATEPDETEGEGEAPETEEFLEEPALSAPAPAAAVPAAPPVAHPEPLPATVLRDALILQTLLTSPRLLRAANFADPTTAARRRMQEPGIDIRHMLP